VEKELKNILPEDPPVDPIYIDLAIPEPTPSNTSSTPCTNTGTSNIRSEPTSSNTSGTLQSTAGSSPPMSEPASSNTSGTLQSITDNSLPTTSTRYEWEFGTTKRLLEIIKGKKSDLETSINKKAIWNTVAAEIMKACKKVHVSGEQCRERFY